MTVQWCRRGKRYSSDSLQLQVSRGAREETAYKGGHWREGGKERGEGIGRHWARQGKCQELRGEWWSGWWMVDGGWWMDGGHLAPANEAGGDGALGERVVTGNWKCEVLGCRPVGI